MENPVNLSFRDMELLSSVVNNPLLFLRTLSSQFTVFSIIIRGDGVGASIETLSDCNSKKADTGIQS